LHHNPGDIPLLNVTTEPLEDCEVLITVEVDEKQTNNLLKAAAGRIARQVRIPGFRPGKAPYNVIVRRFGEEVIRNEALEDLSKSVFEQALDQAEVEPYAQASLEDVTWDPLVMKVRVPVAPVIELGDYRAMRMEVEPVEVTETELEEALGKLQDDYATWNPVERPAQLGDLVTMAVKEQVDDEVLAENESVDYELVEIEEEGSGPDLTTPLIGLSAGDEKEFIATYPETVDDPRYAGQEVTVSVEVHGVKEKESYPLDDDFAQTVGDFDTLEGLKEKLTEDMRRRKEREADRELGEKAFEQLIENAGRIEWPEVLEEEELDQALEEQDRRLQQNGLSLDTYLSMQKKTRDDLREEYRPAVRERLQRSLVLSKVVELEDISVGGHEITDQIDRMSILAGEQGAALREVLTTPDSMRHIASDLLASKAMERLVEIVKGEADAEPETTQETEKQVKAEIDAEQKIETEVEEEKELEEVETAASAPVDE
jgi:trigger factor